jgi:pimeloyl-ACP methyl ester carboxylesterase
MLQKTTTGVFEVVMLGLGAACQPKTYPLPAAAEPARASIEPTVPAPHSSCFLDLNGVRIWHEIYGEGPPVIVLHGGLMTIPEMMPLIAPLSKTRKVVAVELQGHGRSPDTDRPIAFATLADDVAAIVDTLRLGTADVVGLSFGGATALRMAIQHPDKVRRLVVISSPYAKNGWYPKAQEGMATVGAGMAENMKATPTGQFAQQWPEPQRFPQFLDKIGHALGEDYDWSADVTKLPMPVLLVFADHDSVSLRHVAEFFALLGGGISEPGWQNTKFTKSRLAIVPGYSHYNFITSTELPPIVGRFLADPMTNTSSGAAAASKSAR